MPHRLTLSLGLLFGISLLSLTAEELRFVGSLGNSDGDGEAPLTFSDENTAGMGPVFDDEQTLWERGGAARLHRYALDGRLLATFPLPGKSGRNDQMTRVNDRLVMLLEHRLYVLPLDAEPGTEPTRLEGEVEILASSAFEGRVLLFDKDTASLHWLDPVTAVRTPLATPEDRPYALHVDEDGVTYAFGGGQVNAWEKDGSPVSGFPRDFRGDRPQKIGRYWYSHAWHGTVNRMNEHFEPSPGVVLGGASGSFIGYLPQSVDLSNGRGLVEIGDGLFAVSGTGSVIQLLEWNPEELRFELRRRIGAMPGLAGIALDADGTIWTPTGSWHWNDSPEKPATLGDKLPDALAQPIVLEGDTLCLLKKHYQFVQLAAGPLIDANGWSHFETQGLKDFDLPESVTGAAAVPGEKGTVLLVVNREGDAWVIGVTERGTLRSSPKPVSIPDLVGANSLAWFDGRLWAATEAGVIRSYRSEGEAGWKETVGLEEDFGQTVSLHGDGERLAITDSDHGSVSLYESPSRLVARYEGLEQPRHVAVSGNRVVVYEAGRQRLVKLELSSGGHDESPEREPAETIAPGPPNHFDESEFTDLSLPAGLPCSIALVPNSEGGLDVSVDTRADSFTLGIAGENGTYLLRGGTDFHLPPSDWEKGMRLAVSLETPHRRERMGFLDHRPIHATFSPNPSDWAPFEFAAYRETVEARKQEIRLTFEQPVEGKATLVIENERGQRIRNLVSGRDFSAGRHTITWDGFDETGKLVTPGRYHWRGITHPGIKPAYRMHFANGGESTTESWGPNHSTFQDATSNGKLVFFAAPVTEGGYALVALDADGRFVQGYDHQHGYGIQHDAIAADDRYLYCAQDGFAWGGTKNIDFGRDDWTATWKLTVVRYEIESGKLVEFPGKQRALEIDEMLVGPGSDHPDLEDFNLGGLAVKDGQLFIGSRHRSNILVLDAETGESREEIPLEDPRHLAFSSDDQLHAVTDAGLVRVSDGRLLVASGKRPFSGLAVAPDGDLLVSDPNSHQVRRFGEDGSERGVFGTPGGPYKGAYEPERMVNPAGLAFGPDGKLWVTEDRWNPKRVLAWNPDLTKVVYEKFGMPHYGGDGSGFDPENPRRWVGLGCFWDVDIEAGTARPTHILSREEGHFGTYHPHGYVFFREGGRTFLCARGKIALISEVLPDGTLHDLAATAGTHHFGYGCGWEPPQAYIDAFYEKWPEKRSQEEPGQRKGEGKPWSQRGMGVLWVDRNGDGKPQKEEFDFCGDDLAYGDGAWGHLQTSLTLHMPVADEDGVKLVALEPRGFLDNGVPDYPTLDEAIAKATPVSLTPGYARNGVATVRDHSGRFLFNSDPEMNAYAADGSELWTYPNQWSNVHGSHKAPLPEPGVMQGTLGILGLAPFDDEGELFFLNGNHGRCFLLTTDGLYLDEAFVDVRVSYLKNEYRLGGEIFGGSFGRSKPDGKYYVQIGHGPYRIYELEGIDQAKRLAGELEVTPEQIATAERESHRRAAREQTPRAVSLPGSARWDKSGKFKTECDLAIEAGKLELTWRVEDDSPWRNEGRDWTQLFATGDTVDLQLGTDPDADPDRRGPVPGDKRLLIAPHEGEAIAVLYEHRKVGGGENPIEFTSPWRAEKVDDVRRLSDAKIEVKTSDRGYQVTASIPLETLGFHPESGKAYRADFGVTFGDASGEDTNLRSYWSNQGTNLVDDIPGEIMLNPNLWGTLSIEEE